MVTLFDAAETDFSMVGIGVLDPASALVTEKGGGEYEAEIVQYADEENRQLWAHEGDIVRLPCPVRETPRQPQSGTVTRHIYKVHTTTGQRLQLRRAASLTATVLGAYANGTEVAVDGTSGSFSQVTVLKGGASGWMWSQYLDFVRDETEGGGGDEPGGVVETVLARDQLFRIYKIRRSSSERSVTLFARHISYDLSGRLVSPPYAPEKTSAATVCAQLLARAYPANPPFSIHCYSTKPVTADYGTRSVMECLLDPDDGVLTQVGGRLFRDDFDIYILDDAQRDTGTVIRYGDNLVKADYSIDTTERLTSIVPCGKKANGDPLYADPVDREGDEPVVMAKCIEYDVKVGEEGISTEAAAKAKLRELAQADFDGGVYDAKESLDTDFIRHDVTDDFSETATADALHMYDSAEIVDVQMGIRASVRMISYTWDALAMVYTKTELGDPDETV